MRIQAITICFITIALVSCASQKMIELSCAPQNIRFDEINSFLLCDSPKSSARVMVICKNNTFKAEKDEKSCVGERGYIGDRLLEAEFKNIRYIIKPIVLSDEDQFKKKQECSKLTSQIEKRLKEQNESRIGTNFEVDATLGKVFYSISMNSCLYDVREVRYGNGKGKTLVDWILYDGFTNEQLLWKNGFEGTPDYMKFRDEFDKEHVRFE